MLLSDPGKLNTKSKGAVGRRDRGAAERAPFLLTGSFFNRLQGMRGLCGKVRCRERWEGKIVIVSCRPLGQKHNKSTWPELNSDLSGFPCHTLP